MLVAFFASCEGIPDKPAAWETYNTDEYSIRYPSDWELDLSGSLGPEVFLYSPPDETTPEFKENVNLLIQELPDSTDLAAYIAATEQDVVKAGGELITSKSMRDSAGEYGVMAYTYTVKLNGKEMNFRQHVRISDHKAYLLTFTNLQKAPDVFEETAARILGSFRLK